MSELNPIRMPYYNKDGKMEGYIDMTKWFKSTDILFESIKKVKESKAIDNDFPAIEKEMDEKLKQLNKQLEEMENKK